MGIVADRLAAMSLSASTPDGRIEGTYNTADEASLSFTTGAYSSYRERQLEHQLSRLCMRLWTAYQREYDAIFAEATGLPVSEISGSSEPVDANRRRFRAEQAETVSEGMSDRELVYIESTGLTRWHVVIHDGTLRELEEQEFAEQVLSAFKALLADYRAKMSALLTKYYGDQEK